MDVAGGISLVQTILQLLDSDVWKETQSILGVKSQLQKLKNTMSTIYAILRDADEQERLHHGCPNYRERDRLERLKEALYQADDLVDEVNTVVQLKKLMPGNKLSKEVSLFFSQFNQLRSAFTWSREIKSIRERLDDVVKDHQLADGFRQSVVLEDSRVRNNPRETHSYVNLENDVIIGRDDDKRILIDLLLDTTIKGNVSVVSIVGIGGLGKTTLAQLVYNDDKIHKEFPLKMWVCVSEHFNVHALAGQILAVATNQTNLSDGLTMDQLQIKLREVLDRNKYLLVLDDIWNENSEKWRKLKTLLVGGGKDSRILVTTRSKKVAIVVGSCWTHELKGLSDEESWNLFQRMTLEPGQHLIEANLVDIGKEIVRKCVNVPLAIRVVGSLLQGHGESRWRYLNNTDLASIKQDDINGIMPVLKISYYYLPFHLKSCFSYCAVFPKDHKIIKEDLIYLWMAQGFIMQSDGESFEDAGEKYFEQLLQRCFFQDIELAEGTTDEIISCKMHDLIHDLAKVVVGSKILPCNYSTQYFNERTRHVYIDRSVPKDLLGNLTKMNRMRTFLCIDLELPYYKLSFDLGSLVVEVTKVKCLRVLTLKGTGLKTLPSVIGELVHLRYLDLSENYLLCVLPSSITKLYNLQTLNLHSCLVLKELPRELRKLVNLRHLDIHSCVRLTHMPSGMNSMTSLQKLTAFVVSGSGTGNEAGNWESSGVGQLKDLDNFINHHSGTMDIVVQKSVRDAVEAKNGGFLLKSQKLREIKYYWFDISDGDREGNNNAEALLQGLQPHSNLRKFELWDYPGVRLPSWGSSSMHLHTYLPNLVQIKIHKCKRLKYLPLMSRLWHLKVLELEALSDVEYVESRGINADDEDDELVFFPSLEKLQLIKMSKLKRWWKSELESRKGEIPQASKLSHLTIQGCPNLTTFPFCPELQELKLYRFNEMLGPIMWETTHAVSSSSIPNNKQQQQEEEERGRGRLREVEIDNVGYLKSLPIHSFHHLSNLKIAFDQKLKRFSVEQVGHVFQSGCLSSLRSLHIYNCSKLKSISGGIVWEHSTALETLTLQDLPNLELEDEDDVSNDSINSTAEKSYKQCSDAETPWIYLAPTLRSLKLEELPMVVTLPKGIGCLSALQSLSIWGCFNLESLTSSIGSLSSLQSLDIRGCPKLETMPEEMCHLTSLTQLHIRNCSLKLNKRCENKNGADWANIQHIPRISVT